MKALGVCWTGSGVSSRNLWTAKRAKGELGKGLFTRGESVLHFKKLRSNSKLGFKELQARRRLDSYLKGLKKKNAGRIKPEN